MDLTHTHSPIHSLQQSSPHSRTVTADSKYIYQNPRINAYTNDHNLHRMSMPHDSSYRMCGIPVCRRACCRNISTLLLSTGIVHISRLRGKSKTEVARWLLEESAYIYRGRNHRRFWIICYRKAFSALKCEHLGNLNVTSFM